MVSGKKLTKIARKWQTVTALSRKQIGSTIYSGHFVVYTLDYKRFVMPLEYLNCNIIRELLKKSEEVFGLPSGGPIKLPCESGFMAYVISTIKRGLDRDFEQALLISMEASVCSLLTDASQLEYRGHHLITIRHGIIEPYDIPHSQHHSNLPI